MNDRLRRVLDEFVAPPGALGSSPIDRPALRTALAGVTRHLQLMLWIALGMTVLVFLVELGIVFAFIPDQSVLVGVGGAMGLTVAGSIETVRRIARDLAHTNFLIVMAGELDTDALKPVIEALARKI